MNSNAQIIKFYRKFPLKEFAMAIGLIIVLLYTQPNPLLWWSTFLTKSFVIGIFSYFIYGIAITITKLKQPILEFNENGIWHANLINQKGTFYSWKDIKEIELITEKDEYEFYYLNIILNNNQHIELNLNNLTQSSSTIIARLKELYKKPISEIYSWGFYRTFMNIIYLSIPAAIAFFLHFRI